MNSLIPLRCKSEYSLLESTSTCEDLINRALKIESPAIALTDIRSISGAISFMNIANDAGIKPIIGCELAYGEDSILLYAKDINGWHDLLKLVSLSYKNEKENKPILGLKEILEYVSKGNLIGIFLGNNVEDLSCLHSSMGENLFLPLDYLTFRDIINQRNKEWSAKFKIPLVAIPNSHYCDPQGFEDLRVLSHIKYKKDIPSILNSNLDIPTFYNNKYYIPDAAESKSLYTEEAIANSNLINDMISSFDVTAPPNPPEFKCPNGLDPNDYLRQLCRQGWVKKLNHINKDDPLFRDYGERANIELDTFTSVNLSSYFLIVRDILEYVKSKGFITGVGRGSAGGCLVSYLIGITQADPIKYDLLFERFYNAGRNAPGKISWPDIDFDIPRAAKDLARNYVRNKYGEDNVAQIITYQTLKGKAALTRVMSSKGNIGFAEQKAITKLLLDESQVSDELKDIEEEYGFSSSIIWALENKSKELKEWCYIGKDGKLAGKFSKLFEQAIRLEHTKIIPGKHPAGIVISNQPINEICPMVLGKDKDQFLAGFEGEACEAVGLLKLDCLTTRVLDKIMEV